MDTDCLISYIDRLTIGCIGLTKKDRDRHRPFEGGQQVSKKIKYLNICSSKYKLHLFFRAVSASFSTVFFPLVPWILQAVVIVFSLLVLLFLASIGVPVYKVNGLNTSLTCVCTNGYMEGDICDPVAFNENCRDTSRIYDQERCLDAACHFQEVDTPGIVRFFHVSIILLCYSEIL